MNTELPKMHDIILPAFQEPIWPLPISYWICIITLMIIIAVGSFATVRHKKIYKARSQALKELKTMHHYELNAYSALTKRVAIHYYGRESIAQLSGQAWLNQLKSWAPTDQHPTLEQLFELRYQKQQSLTENRTDLQPLFKHIIIQCSKKKGALHAHV